MQRLASRFHRTQGVPLRGTSQMVWNSKTLILCHQTINLDKFGSYSTNQLSAIYNTELRAIPASGLKKTKPCNRVALNTEHPLNIREYGWITRQDNTVSPLRGFHRLEHPCSMGNLSDAGDFPSPGASTMLNPFEPWKMHLVPIPLSWFVNRNSSYGFQQFQTGSNSFNMFQHSQ